MPLLYCTLGGTSEHYKHLPFDDIKFILTL